MTENTENTDQEETTNPWLHPEPRYIPADCGWQIGTYRFKFDIISGSVSFKRKVETFLQEGLFLNICQEALSSLSREEILALHPEQYPNVVQKSSTWLSLRSMAQGTASSVGKYIKGPPQYPSLDDIREAWLDKLQEKPFQKTHTMRGHMTWGVGYEDPALVHFALHNQLAVTQVGTVRVDLTDILSLAKKMYHKDMRGNLETKDVHLLISPDGLVGNPEQQEGKQGLTGMLEIKCISPFHHVEIGNHLEWVSDMESRQWYHPEQIPFVYVIQLGLQALAGKTFYNMKERDTMWFIRWSPRGFSQFTISFQKLWRLGIPAALLYLSQIQQVQTVEDVGKMFPYRGKDVEYYKLLCQAYQEVMDSMTHEYVPIDEYPEFEIYRECTEHFRFLVEDIELKPVLPTRQDSPKILDMQEESLEQSLL